MTQADTIFALASAPGRAGIAVLRLSGPSTRAAIERLGATIPPPRVATRAKFKRPDGELLDDGLILFFPAPRSFTGEDVAELHVHGGRAVIEDMLNILGTCAGLRPAEPGEFTRRAFTNDKMDLTQAEALADLVDAETRAQARQALLQMGGALKELTDDWRHKLVQALAHLEAVIDFPDEDLPPEAANKVWGQVRDLEAAIAAHLDDGHRGERIRDGLVIAIIGAPNAGKSSLLNALARRDAAIVSPIPGTTRDVIDVHLDIGGYAVTVADTAGLRAAGDAIETEGIRRAQARARNADIRIAVFDGASFPARDDATQKLMDKDTLAVTSKADLLETAAGDGTFISTVTGFGMTSFMKRLEDAIKARFDVASSASVTRLRHRTALEECRAHLRRATQARLPELAAEDLRQAARALGRITGRVDVEEILDAVFRDFCIGK